MTFEEFLVEGVNDSFLYHNTDWLVLTKIIDSGKLIGRNGFISFSRSKRYINAPGTYNTTEVRFIFDRKTLNQKRKIEPYADNSVISSGGWRDDIRVSGYAAKWESEELVNGDIPITKQYGLIAIEVLKPVIEKHITMPIRIRKNAIEKYIDEKIPRLKDGYFWNEIKKDWDLIVSDRQKKIHNLIKYQENIEKLKQELMEYETFLDKVPNLKIVNSFN